MGIREIISKRFGIQDFTDLPEKISEGMASTGKEHTDDLNGGQRMDYMTAAAYSAIYSKVSTIVKDMYREIDEASKSYLIEVIIDIICESTLSPDLSSDKVLDVTSSKALITKEIKYLDKKLSLDLIAKSVCRDLVKYGSYYLRTHIRKAPEGGRAVENPEEKDPIMLENVNEVYGPFELKASLTSHQQPHAIRDEVQAKYKPDDYGLIDLTDDVDQSSIVPLSSFTKTIGYIYRDTDARMAFYEKSDFVEFVLEGKKMRIDMETQFFNSTKEFLRTQKQIKDKYGYEIPRYVRRGRSVLMPALGKIRELELLEAIVPAAKLSKLAAGTIVSVMVPERMDIKEAMGAMEYIEGIINKQKGISAGNGKKKLTVESIMNKSGQIKAIPNFGGATGSLDVMQTRSDEPDDLLSSVNDIRSVILSSVGVPSELVFLNEAGDKKEILKRYARFLKLLRGIQKAIGSAVQQIVMIHLSNKYTNQTFANEDVVVTFKNKLVEVDALDALEFSDTVIQSATNIKNAVFELVDPDSPVNSVVDLKIFVEKLAKLYDTVGFEGVINPEKFVKKKITAMPDDEE